MRLIPRFSLRLALIALTIFLIVFGVAVNLYQRYHTHERVASKLTNAGVAVEEHDSIVLGCLMSRTMVGLDCTHSMEVTEGLMLLSEVPRPGDLQRFALAGRITNQESLEKLFAALNSFSKLEELHLEYQTFTVEQLQSLGSLRQLRILDLSGCNLPGGLNFLKQLTKLETLTLEESKFSPAEFLAYELPNLRTLVLNNTPLAELPLTKQGWARFQRLEKIVLDSTKLNKVEFEAGAMPALKYLDLAKQNEASIDWAKLPETAPQLTGLAMPSSQLTPQVVQVLRRMPNLRYLHLNNEEYEPTPRHDRERPAEEFNEKLTLLTKQPELNNDGIADTSTAVYIPKSIEPQARELLKLCPQLIFCRDYTIFHDLVAPELKSRNIDRYNRAHPWVASTWRAGTRYTPANPFDDPFGLPSPTPPTPSPFAADPFAPPSPLANPPAPAADPFAPRPSPLANPSAPAADPFGPATPMPIDPFGAPPPSSDQEQNSVPKK